MFQTKRCTWPCGVLLAAFLVAVSAGMASAQVAPPPPLEITWTPVYSAYGWDGLVKIDGEILFDLNWVSGGYHPVERAQIVAGRLRYLAEHGELKASLVSKAILNGRVAITVAGHELLTIDDGMAWLQGYPGHPEWLADDWARDLRFFLVAKGYGSVPAPEPTAPAGAVPSGEGAYPGPIPYWIGAPEKMGGHPRMNPLAGLPNLPWPPQWRPIWPWREAAAGKSTGVDYMQAFQLLSQAAAAWVEQNRFGPNAARIPASAVWFGLAGTDQSAPQISGFFAPLGARGPLAPGAEAAAGVALYPGSVEWWEMRSKQFGWPQYIVYPDGTPFGHWTAENYWGDWIATKDLIGSLDVQIREAARRLFARAINTEPAYYHAWHALGVLESFDGEYEVAARDLVTAIELRAHSGALPHPYYELGLVKSYTNDMATARNWWRKSLLVATYFYPADYALHGYSRWPHNPGNQDWWEAQMTGPPGTGEWVSGPWIFQGFPQSGHQK